ncbi:MAG: nucleotide exchange factor GrpE [bacterium]|nr:nucleotide exchange factor GrpE [bacterium]
MTKDDKKYKGEIEELTNKWKRALADYQNLERRVAKEREDFVKFVSAGLILKLLPALDSLEKAETHLKDEGLSLAIKQLKQALEEEGLEKIETADKEFDPQEMECVEICRGKEGVVLEEVRSGCKLKGKVIRVAQVKVGKKTGENK